MANKEVKQFMIEDARIMFTNFEGVEKKFNKLGDRNFCVELEEEYAQQLLADGWNVKWPAEREMEEGEEDTRKPYLKVTVGFKGRPPSIAMIAGTQRTYLNEHTVAILDSADITTTDLIANAYEWDINGKQGITPYVKTMFVNVNLDYLEAKYNTLGVDNDE